MNNFEHPFGEVVPGEAVVSHGPVLDDGFRPRRRRMRDASNKWIYTDALDREKAEMTTANLTAPNAMSVYDCIVAVSQELAAEGISKNRSNQQQNYKFRGIDDVLNALSPLLAKYRLVILPRILSRTVVERATQKGGVLFYVTVEAEFDFVSAADSSVHTVKTYGEAMDSADKATNKAMSAAYKYAAFQTFCIPTEGDNDADTVTHDVRPAYAPAPSGQPRERETSGGRAGENNGRSQPASDDGPYLGTADDERERDWPPGFRLIDDYKLDGDWHQVTWGRDAKGGWAIFKTKLAKIGLEAHNAFTEHVPVLLHSKKPPYLDKVERI